MLGYRVLGLDYSFLRGALSPPTTHPGGLTQSAPVLTLEDPQPPFKPGDPLPHRQGKKNTAIGNCPKARRAGPITQPRLTATPAPLEKAYRRCARRGTGR